MARIVVKLSKKDLDTFLADQGIVAETVDAAEKVASDIVAVMVANVIKAARYSKKLEAAVTENITPKVTVTPSTADNSVDISVTD